MGNAKPAARAQAAHRAVRSEQSDITHIYELGANSFIAKPLAFDTYVNTMAIIGGYWSTTVEVAA